MSVAVVVLRCRCGARASILSTRAMVTGWTDRGYECDRCSPFQPDDDTPVDPQLEALIRQPPRDLLARAL